MASKPFEFPVPGLPALPKSLSALLNTNSGASWQEAGRIHVHRTNIQDSLNGSLGDDANLLTEHEEEVQSVASSKSGSLSRGKGPRKRIEIPKGNLDAALALLRKEMVGLRQLDMSLLSQLWALYEAIQEYKNSMSYGDSSLEYDNEDSSQSLSTPLSPLPEDSSSF